jgi:hypothetical protein
MLRTRFTFLGSFRKQIGKLKKFDQRTDRETPQFNLLTMKRLA